MNETLRTLILLLSLALTALASAARETVFADYFDIRAGSPAGSEVTGRIHLARNKDAATKPIPRSYRFEIADPAAAAFTVSTDFDPEGRITGTLRVKGPKDLPAATADYRMDIRLLDGDGLVTEFPVTVHAVPRTMWSVLHGRYAPLTLKNPRLYGKKKLSDEEVAREILALEKNGGRFPGEKCYTASPQDYSGRLTDDDHRKADNIEYDWIQVAERIGALGYAYATSAVYGPGGNPARRSRLREAIFDAILAYTYAVPVKGTDIEIDGKPIGDCTGDGFSLLRKHRLAAPQVLTHQWLMTDPLVVPAVHLMPEIIDGMKRGDEKCTRVHRALLRYMQIFMSLIDNRRDIDNPDERWGRLTDSCHSRGAWADANLSHRSRTMLALPIIWADYNRPVTYVPYWYPGFYPEAPEGFTIARGWSPRGVAADVAWWLARNDIPASRYRQSGFQPDGTVSHHIGHGTDAAMMAYGFGWLTDINNSFRYFKDTPWEIDTRQLQFELDRLLDVYPKLFYRRSMDWLVSGRSFLDDSRRFVTKAYAGAVRSLLKTARHTAPLHRADSLRATLAAIEDDSFDISATVPFWVNEFLVHRRGGDKPFYASVKLKSSRTVGAEDFDRHVRHSWHMGYGIVQLKVDGDEYSRPVLAGFDWHALPGLTEEWRRDPLPREGGAQASLPGLNEVAGVLADGVCGMAVYHHLPGEEYSSAEAHKSYGFIDRFVLAQGSAIKRRRPGTGAPLTTFIDQGAFDSPLTIGLPGEPVTLRPGESVDKTFVADRPFWIHTGSKGYLVRPDAGAPATLRIVTGDSINVTDPALRAKIGRAGFIIALDHGTHPAEGTDTYRYALAAHATAASMPGLLDEFERDITFAASDSTAHALRSARHGIRQFAFFRPGSVTLDGLTVSADAPAQLMLRDTPGGGCMLSVGNPAPDDSRATLTFILSEPLPAGTYPYTIGGIYPMEGETITIAPHGAGSKVTVELPDARDSEKYAGRTPLYSAAPIILRLPPR